MGVAVAEARHQQAALGINYHRAVVVRLRTLRPSCS